MTTQPGWDGSQPHTSSTPQHEWQTPPEAKLKARSFRKSRLAFAGWLGIGVAMLAGLVYSLPYSPDKTPCFVLVESNYPVPMSVNGWAEDDVALLRELDSENIAVYPVAASWDQVAGGLTEFSRQVKALSADATSCGSCILYVNAHGLVDDQGQPCIVPAAGQPHDTSTWIPVEDLLNQVVDSLPESVNKLIVLDCARIQSDWNLGVFYNAFSERVVQLIAEKRYPNLAVINSASAGEVAWPRSNFALRMMQGLAGKADGYPDLATDSRVSTSELFDYIRDGVQPWAIANRGETQSPRLLGGSSKDFQITIPAKGRSKTTSAVGESLVEKLDQRKSSSRQVDPPVSVIEITDLWALLNALTKQTPLLRLNPIRLRNLQQELFRLEQLQRSGPSLATETRESYSNLGRDLETLTDANWSTLSEQWIAVGHRQPHFQELIKPHSLPIAEMVGTIQRVDANRLRSSLEELITEASRSNIVPVDAAEQFTGLTEYQFLKIARSADVLHQWPSNLPFAQLARLRIKVESLAVPFEKGVAADHRSHRAIRPTIESVFRSLRPAEDQLWVGGNVTTDIDKLITVATTDFDHCQQRLETVGHAFEVADRMYLELPYIGQWLGDGWLQLHSENGGVEQQQFREKFEDLVSQVDRLGKLIVLILEADEATATVEFDARIADIVSTMAAGHRSLRAEIKTYAESISAYPEDSIAVWREIRAVLMIPFLTSDIRAGLLNREEELRSKLQGQFEEDAPVNPVSGDWTTADRVQRLLAWSPEMISPFILDDEHQIDMAGVKAVGTLDETVDALNQKVRRALRDLSKQSAPLEAINESPGNLSAMAAAARNVRRGAAIWFDSFENNVFQIEHVIAVRDLMLWTAAQSLEDCWGGDDLNQQDSASNIPFFATVAADYLEAASSLTLPFDQSELDIETLRQRTDRQLTIASNGIIGVAEDSSLTPGMGDVTISARYQSSMGSLPAGTAAIFLRSSDGKRVNVSQAGDSPDSRDNDARHAITIPLPKDSSVDLQLLTKRIPAAEGSVKLVAFYRGLEFLSQMTIGSMKGNRIEYRPKEFETSNVTLSGEARQAASIVFVLDCSQSMGDTIPGEAPGSLPRAKLDIARSILSEMLNEIAIRESSRVGIRFFGHRLGWSTTQPVRLLTQPDYALPIPRPITASTDVEEVLSLGRFEGTEFQKVNKRLQTVVPWGQSPLHLAIMQSVADFEADDTDTDRSIVVITDGVNYQFTPVDRVTADSAPTSLDAVLRRLNVTSIPVHILGFGVDSNEQAAAAGAFDAIADATGGSFDTAQNGRDLLEVLQNHLGFGRYRVVTVKRNGPDSDAEDSHLLNQTVSVELPRQRPVDARVEFKAASADIQLLGGEWIKLQLVGPATIASIPYEQNSPISESLVLDRGESVGHLFRVHRPTKERDGVRFTVSLQSLVTPFTQRPAEVWLEVSPVGAVQETYNFYDAHFQPDEPVPVLTWIAQHWPVDADEALVRFWCKPKLTPATHVVNLKDIGATPEKFKSDNPVPGIPGVTYRIDIRDSQESRDSFEIKVLELHDSNSSGIGSLRIDLDAGQTPVQQVDRYSDQVNQIATHTFRIHEVDRDALLSSAETAIRFTPRGAIESGAWHLKSDAIKAIIRTKDGVFPLEASEANEAFATPKLLAPTADDPKTVE